MIISKIYARISSRNQQFCSQLTVDNVVEIDWRSIQGILKATITRIDVEKPIEEPVVSFNYWHFSSHLPSLISAVISLGVFPSTLTPNATHVPMMVFATDFSEEA